VRALAALAVLAAAPAAATPARVASLNLCSDELVLALARPGQLASVSRLGADARETPLALRARGVAINRGRISDVVALRPDLVITMRADPATLALARQLGLPLLALPEPQTLADVKANIARVAAALGRQPAGAALIARITALEASPPPARPALLVAGGGLTVAHDGLTAAWLRLAGLAQQPVPAGQIPLERLLLKPPAVLLISRYRADEASGPQAWLAHPALARLPASTRRISTDGRPWTCGGPAMIDEIMALRGRVQ
jgi:iron complex transport system substrate-binding protein